MNLRSLLKPFNRRSLTMPVKDDRRDTVPHRLNAVTARLDSAIDDLCQTVSMSRSDFNAMLERDRVHDLIEFATFSGNCKHRYINGDGMTARCRHPEHEKTCTGLELCNSADCPRLRKPDNSE